MIEWSENAPDRKDRRKAIAAHVQQGQGKLRKASNYLTCIRINCWTSVCQWGTHSGGLRSNVCNGVWTLIHGTGSGCCAHVLHVDVYSQWRVPRGHSQKPPIDVLFFLKFLTRWYGKRTACMAALSSDLQKKRRRNVTEYADAGGLGASCQMECVGTTPGPMTQG